MRKWLLMVLAAAAAILPAHARMKGPVPAPATEAGAVKQVLVIPIRDEIAEPALYILRRGLKEAIARHDDVVVLDLKTPGGAIDVTFQMMEALEKFPGLTIAYVDNEAMSAGAFVSAVTSEIWFAPDGVIGAAAPVTGTGQDVDSTMKQKLVSYLKARMRSISEGKGYRGQVISAMIDADLELKIDGQVLKPKGELLSLTATEAMKAYGRPSRPLLGAGIAPDIDALLARKFGARGFARKNLTATWSENLAVGLNRLSPVLMGLGLVALFAAFKMGNFGLIGFGGLALLGIVFLSHYVAGFSGHEPILLFALGVLLLGLELAFFHTAGFLGVVGAGFILASLIWAMADLWPNEPLSVAWSADAFSRPLANLAIGLVIAGVLGALLLRFLPSRWLLGRMVIGASIGGAAQASSAPPGSGALLASLVGARGVAATALRPGGQVDVGGRRFEAKVELGHLEAGTVVVVLRLADFGLVVEKAP